MKQFYLFIFGLFICFSTYAQVQIGTTNYPTLTAAFNVIGYTNTYAGQNITIEITASFTETSFPSLGANNYASILIKPTGGARTITFASYGLAFNGPNITIDGEGQLTLASSLTNAATLSFTGSAGVTVKRCKILGSGNTGVLSVTSHSSLGQSKNILIQDNEIGPYNSNWPLNGIYVAGLQTNGWLIDNVVIENNRVHDFASQSMTATSCGIYVSDALTVSVRNNRIYQTAPRSSTMTRGISVSDLSMYTNNYITGNEIGSSNVQGTGMYQHSGGTFVGIYYYGEGSASDYYATLTVEGNAIRNIAVTGSYNYIGSTFSAIQSYYGAIKVINNTIGSQSATGSITVTNNSSGTCNFDGITTEYGGNTVITNNTVGGMTGSGGGNMNFFGIYTDSSVLGNAGITFSGNTVGGNVANSIQNNATTSDSRTVGIFFGNRHGGLSGNIVRNMTGYGSGSADYGVVGIAQYSNTYGSSMIGNSIYNITNGNSAAASSVVGIFHYSASAVDSVKRNNIYNLNSLSNHNSATAVGILTDGIPVSLHNNTVALGTGTINNAGISGIRLSAFLNSSGSGLDIKNNSVYIGGTKSEGNAASRCFWLSGLNEGYQLYNNIFVNNRTNGAASTASHYSVQLDVNLLSLKANVYFGNGLGYVLAKTSAGNKTTLAELNSFSQAPGNSGFFSNPRFIAPTAATPNLHISASIPTVVEGRGYDDVGIDVDNETRSGLTPHDIGADAGSFTRLEIPTITSLNSYFLCAGDVLTVTGTNLTSVAEAQIGSTPVTIISATATSMTINVGLAAASGNLVLSNSLGSVSSGTVNVYVKPTINTHPVSVAVLMGNPATLTVNATNASGYIWRLNGTLLEEGFSFAGTTTPTLTINNTYSISGSDVFDVIVYGGNYMCTVTSTTAVVTANHSPGPTIIASGPTTFCAPGSVTLSTGYNGPALQFDGVNDYVEMPSGISGDFTIEYWVKTTQTGPTGTPQWHTGKGIVDAEVSGNTSDFGTSLYGSKLAFGLGGQGTTNDYTIFSTSNINTGQWVHVAVTRVKNTGAMKLFINGILEASGTAPVTGFLNPTNVRVGGLLRGDGFFAGSVDQVRMWNYAMPQSQVKSSMYLNFTSYTSGVVQYVSMDEGSGTSIALKNGTATLMNGVTWTTRTVNSQYNEYWWSNGATTPSITVSETGSYYVYVTDANGYGYSFPVAVTQNGLFTVSSSATTIIAGQSATLTASNDAMQYQWSPSAGLSATTGSTVVASPLVTTTYTATSTFCNTSHSVTVRVLPQTSATDNALNFDGIDDFVAMPVQSAGVSGTFTVEFWVKPGEATKNMNLFNTRSSGSSGNNFDIQILNGNLIHGDIGNGTTWLTTNANANFSYLVNQWMHIAYVVTPSNYRIYANGNEVGYGEYSDLTPVLYDNISNFMQLGKNNGENTVFRGAMDDLRIYNTALTASQIIADAKGNYQTDGLTAFYNFDEGIAGGANPTVTTLNEQNVTGNLHGALSNFALNGSASNWVIGQSVQQQTIAMAGTNSIVYGSSYNPSAVASSGLPVTYVSSNPLIASVSGSTILIHNVGTVQITATQAGNVFYNAAPSLVQTLTITPKTLTISSPLAQNKTYDRNTAATIVGVLTGVVGSDVVSFTGAGTFASFNAGTAIGVTQNTVLTGADASKYTLTPPTGLSANITPKPLAVSGATANNKPFDGTTAATISGAVLNGIISPDQVFIASNAGTFASANVGNNIPVTAQLALGGAGAANYSIIQPVGLSANINQLNFNAVISGTASICQGESSVLNVAITNNTTTFTVRYTDGTLIYTINNYTSGQSISVSPMATSTYTLISVTATNTVVAVSGSATVTVNQNITFYRDADADGFGDINISLIACVAPTGYVTNQTDCDDTDVTIHQLFQFYVDADHDNYGVGGPVTICAINATAPPVGYALNNTDCDDANSSVYRQRTLFVDLDGDAYSTGIDLVCYGATVPAGYSLTSLGTDCDDNNPAVYRTATFYIDGDGDGYNVGTMVLCYGATVPAGYSLSTNGTDCDDSNAEVYRQGVLFVDADGDAYTTGIDLICYGVAVPTGYSTTSLGNDCDDNNAAVYRTGTFYVDTDGDGFSVGIQAVCYGGSVPTGYSIFTNGPDCDDTNININQEFTFYIDADGDTFGSTAISNQCAVNANTPPPGYSVNNTDCNDLIAAVNPAASEILYDGVDNNCNNQLDEGFQMTTKLLPSVCGTTLTSIGSLIGITTVNSTITGYRIKVTNGTDVQIIERNVPHFTLMNLGSYAYATTYTVEIMLQRFGVWLGYYGEPCLVSSPAVLAEGGATQVNPSQCGITLPRINTLIATTSLPGVTGYRFKVTNITSGATGPNVIQTIDRSQHWFSLPMLAQYNYSSTYRVEVAVKTNGAYSGFGAPCEVSSPASPSLINCGGVIASQGTLIAATSLPGITQYRFRISRMSNGATTTIDRNSNSFSFAMVPGYAPAEQYAVSVAVMTMGTWSPYGDACEITAPGTAARFIPQEVTPIDASFKATAYPNPFASAFAIDVTTLSAANLQINVYDMTGRLIETRDVQSSKISELEVGDNLPTGVYNVVVTQGENVETLRVIKR